MRSTRETRVGRGAARDTALRIVLVGTGTGVGKTHVACALLACWSERTQVAGLKPIETGIPTGGAARPGDSTSTELRGAVARRARGAVPPPRWAGTVPDRARVIGAEPTDQERLTESSGSFHVKHARRQRAAFQPHRPPPQSSLFAFPDPVSPHLAARQVGTRIDLGLIERWVHDHEAPITVIETAGGLFSPLGHTTTNFELMQALRPSAVVVVASDRLGVLHDLTTTLALAASRGGPPLGVVLSAPSKKDASTGRNAQELEALGIAHPIAVFPRAPLRAPASVAAACRVIAWIERCCDPATRTWRV